MKIGSLVIRDSNIIGFNGSGVFLYIFTKGGHCFEITASDYRQTKYLCKVSAKEFQVTLKKLKKEVY